MDIDSKYKSNCYILGAVKNCGPYITKSMTVLQKLGSVFNNYHIIIAYDESNDNTLTELQSSKIFFESNGISFDILICNNTNKSRTINLSNARNTLLNAMREHKSDDDLNLWNYFIVIDCDDVAAIGDINTKLLSYYLKRSDDWDSLSFNRDDYYDIWALSFDDYIWSCWGFKEKKDSIVAQIKTKIMDKLNSLNKDDLLPCYSAFNGLAIYKVDKFINCEYDYKPPKKLIDVIDNNIIKRNEILVDDEIVDHDDCEHRHFHLQAIIKNNAKIRISPLNIYNRKEDFTVFDVTSLKLYNNLSIIILSIVIIIMLCLLYVIYHR